MRADTSKRALAIVFLAALALRLVLLLTLDWRGHVVDSYDVIADNLVAGRGFSYDGAGPTVCRAPGYPVYLAALTGAFGAGEHRYTTARVADALLDSLTALLVVLACRRWFPRLGSGAPTAAGLVHALNPFMAYYAVKLGSETLAAFCFALYLLALHPALVEGGRPGRLRWALAMGLAGGALILNKSVFLPVVVAVPALVFALFPGVRSRRWWRHAALATAVSLAAAAPWTVRNYRVSGRFVPVQTLAGYNFWYDFAQDRSRNDAVRSGDWRRAYRGETVTLPDGTPYHPYRLDAAEDAARDQDQVSAALRWARRHPGAMARKALDNLAAFWYQTETPAKMLAAGLFSLLLLALSAAGAAAAPVAGRGREALFLLAVVLLLDAVYSPVLAVFRYSLVTYPALAILGGVALGRAIPAALARARARGAAG